MKVSERKVQEIAGSFLVSLPKPWADGLHLKKGSILRLATTAQGTILISPEIIKNEQKKETVINFDENFGRMFFREYFAGYEEIIFKMPKGTRPDDKKKIYPFLKKFMNVQIIEDTEERLVLKSFKIEELSIEDCLKRMYYLTLNMIDELLASHDTLRQKELENNVKKFYYMLVMQIRRFIGEGKFAEQNQISLLRAVDCRMVGMKMDEIAEIISGSEPIANKDIIRLLEEAKEMYKSSFMSFINEDYEKALTLWQTENKIKAKYEKLIKESKRKGNIKEYQQVIDCLQMLKLSRRISMLTR